jgi:predicted lysophospholipase L1 biosynthesis ABC-type transport system permease subunit
MPSLGVRWLISRKAADLLPTSHFILLCACTSLLSVVGAVAIGMLVLHLPLTGPFSIQHWLIYGVSYTIFSTGFALLGRHKRMRRPLERDQPGAWGRIGR